MKPKSPPHEIPSLIAPERIQSMFDAIAPTYDLLNHLLSFGLDIRWRKKAIRLLKEKQGGVILDIAAGSGDVSIDLLDTHPRQIIGSDFSLKMLKVFREKLDDRIPAHPITLIACDALRLPFRNDTFDATIVAFGVRNFSDRSAALGEMVRVLKPDGMSVILELSTPRTPIARSLYHIHSRMILPVVGKIISRNSQAYTYLPESIAGFPDKQAFLSLMELAGFRQLQAYPLTFGAATIYAGRK